MKTGGAKLNIVGRNAQRESEEFVFALFELSRFVVKRISSLPIFMGRKVSPQDVAAPPKFCVNMHDHVRHIYGLCCIVLKPSDVKGTLQSDTETWMEASGHLIQVCILSNRRTFYLRGIMEGAVILMSICLSQ